MSEHDTKDMDPTLADAFAAFNKSADKLSSLYGRLAARAPGQEFQFPSSGAHAQTLLLGALECVPGGIIVVDHECRAVASNTAVQELTGMSGDQIVNSTDIFAETIANATSRCSRTPSLLNIAVETRTTPIADGYGSIIGAVGVLRHKDTSLPSTTSPERSLTPILVAIGDVILTIAHKMRSPLSAIQLFAELLKQDLDRDKQEIVDEILVGVHSLDAVLSNLLSFAQPVKPNLTEVNLAEILDESLVFALPAIKQQAISLVKTYSHDDLHCCGDLEQLSQVCFNLILNAIQAMPEGGELRISALNIREADARKHINIEIQDNGCGIADEAIDRVFTPFFTTKEGGTGLGLCVVYKVVQAHQGAVQISSNYGRGTIVSIQLPIEQG